MSYSKEEYSNSNSNTRGTKRKNHFPQSDQAQLTQRESADPLGDIIAGYTEKEVLGEIQSYPLLYEAYLKNSPQIQKRIINSLLRQPSTSDTPGYIYGFMDFNQNGPYEKNYFIKMGRTKIQHPQIRIYQWDKQDNHQYTQIFTIRTEYNIKLEALVHLFYDYARTLRIINNKRRIQWFYFKERVLTASAVQNVNEIMYRIQIPSLRKETITTDSAQFIKDRYSLENVLKNAIEFSNHLIKSKRVTKKLVLVGLQNKTLDIVKQLFQGRDMKYKGKSLMNYQFETQETKSNQVNDFDVQCLPLNRIDGSIEKTFISLYDSWSKIFSAKEIHIMLVIKQSDLQSSELTGLVSTLELLKQFIDIQISFQKRQKFTVCTFMLDPQLDQEAVKKFIESKQLDLNSDHYKIVTEAKHIIIPKPSKVDQILTLPVENIQAICSSFGEDPQTVTTSLKFNHQVLRSLCKQFVSQQYYDLNKIILQSFIQTQENLKQQNGCQKAETLGNIMKVLAKLSSYCTHHQVYTLLHQLLDLLYLKSNHTQKEMALLMVYTFAQSITEGNMRTCKIFQDLKVEVKKDQINLRDLINGQIDRACQEFRTKIESELKRTSVNSLNQCGTFIQLIQLLQGIKNKLFTTQEQCVWFLESSIFMDFRQLTEIVKTARKKIFFEQHGIPCTRVFSKLKDFSTTILKLWQQEKLYLQFKTRKLQSNNKIAQFSANTSEKTNTTHKQEKMYRQSKSQECSKNVTQKKQSTPQSHYQKTQLALLKQANPREQSEKNSTFYMDNFQSLFLDISGLAENHPVMNICKGDFIFNVCNVVTIKNSLILIAKTITIQNELTIQGFVSKTDDKKKNKGKNYLIILAELFTDVEKLQIIKSEGWNICMVQISEGEVMLLNEKHRDKMIKRLKIWDLINIYRCSIPS